jgi:peroxiredoxin
MALMHTPEVALGMIAPDFDLPGIDGRRWSLADSRGPKGLVVMFICNHCPYVKAIRTRLVDDCRALQRVGIGCVAINSNDTDSYPEDDFDHMIKVAGEYGFPFPYLLDESQSVAREYGAICTPDFFGFNADLELQYRGRLDAAGANAAAGDLRRDLVEAMREVAETGQGPSEQFPSMGCSLKWR